MRRADYHARVILTAIKYPKTVLPKVCCSLNEGDFPVEKLPYFQVLKKCLQDNKLQTPQIIDSITEAGLDYQSIIASSSVPYTADSIDEPIKIIQERSNIQKIKLFAEQLVADTKDREVKAETLIVEGINALTTIKTKDFQKSISQQVDDLVNNFKKYEGKKFFGVRTGFEYVDNLTRGMQTTHLWIMGGYTSIGKSWFAIQLFSKWVLEGHKALFISLEQSAETILTRMACTEAQVTDYEAKTGRMPPGKKEIFYGILHALKETPMVISDGLFTWDEVKFRILQSIFADGAKCIVIDYLQNIVVPKTASEYESLNIVVRELQRMAVKHGVFILALSQINRSSQSSQDEKVFGFKGSGNLENAADVAVILRKPDSLENHVIFDVAKDRNGMIGKNLCKVDYSIGKITDKGKYVV